jgi:hypothetical protein
MKGHILKSMPIILLSLYQGKFTYLNQKILALFTNKNRKSRSQEEFKQNKKKIRA